MKNISDSFSESDSSFKIFFYSDSRYSSTSVLPFSLALSAFFQFTFTISLCFSPSDSKSDCSSGISLSCLSCDYSPFSKFMIVRSCLIPVLSPVKNSGNKKGMNTLPFLFPWFMTLTRASRGVNPLCFLILHSHWCCIFKQIN